MLRWEDCARVLEEALQVKTIKAVTKIANASNEVKLHLINIHKFVTSKLTTVMQIVHTAILNKGKTFITLHVAF